MNTDMQALEAIGKAIRRTDLTKTTVAKLSVDILEALHEADLQVFEAAPAQKESQ